MQLAMRMEPFVFAPSELPEPHHLYVIHRGIVMHGLRVLTSGRMWGEEVLLDDTSTLASMLSAIPTVLGTRLVPLPTDRHRGGKAAPRRPSQCR